MPDGYHYGFLEPLRVDRVKSEKHVGQIYDIHLFAFSPNGKKVYIGCLHNAIGISSRESIKVYTYYEKQGWIKQMKKDVNFVGGEIKEFEPRIMFNVKFKFSEAEIDYSNIRVLGEYPRGHRYNLMDKKEDFDFVKDEDGNIEILDTSLISRTNQEGKIVIDPYHKKIQNAVVEILKSQYDHLSLESGLKDGNGQRVDIKGRLKGSNEWHYFEVKTQPAKDCIREALGQILEYAHYPATNRASKLFIIGPIKPDEHDCAYMEFIRKTYNIPIWFRWYSFEHNTLHTPI